ncbi:MAG: dihydrodipicolinate reductase C-terminal domain-containing protein [Bryobacterales bacterium]|nr:dihydrodipicolinate reductase [Bryobacteraceae bacterium]MDW8129274.1 dihydrodipicolinate reductase C-terminal domain-containing protein [Bryobacterales bacterium]
MKLALVGYGKMGRLIEQLAPEYGFQVALRLDEHNNAGCAGITEESFRDVDVAMEFSTPETAVANIERIAALGVNLVVGTTGWTDRLDSVRELIERAGVGMVWSPNYSVGMNIFFRLAGEAARLMATREDYGAWAWEIHHSAKKDAPSGTLLKLVATMREAGYARPVNTGCNRAGAHPGTHEIGFDSAADTITLRHAARSREGFARGALEAARWIRGKKGFYEFAEILWGRL